MARKYKWERLTASRMVSPSPCDVSTVVVTADDAAQAKATFYDGESASDPQVMKVKTGSGQSKLISFDPPLHTLRGLYVAFTASCEEVMICYDISEE